MRKLRAEDNWHLVQLSPVRGGREGLRSGAWCPPPQPVGWMSEGTLTPAQGCSLLPCSEVEPGPQGSAPAPPWPMSPAGPRQVSSGKGPASNSRHLPKPELSACSDIISFPLSRSIASTGFQFVFPEIHLPATFLINSPPNTPEAPIDHPLPSTSVDHRPLAPPASGEWQVCLKLYDHHPQSLEELAVLPGCHPHLSPRKGLGPSP